MIDLFESWPDVRRVEAHRPWPRAWVTPQVWREIAARFATRELTLFGLWGDTGAGDLRAVHMALLDERAGRLGIATLECPDGRFPSAGAVHPPAIRLERTARDLFGLEPEGLEDRRPWLAHQGAYAFLPAEGEDLHQIPVGPVHAGIIEPGHFRFTASGETVVRLEQRLGYVHKGIEALMAGASLTRGAQLAGRTSGDSTVAYAIAFSQAAEHALGIAVPERALWLRALMAELERLANHFGDIGAICNDASFALMHAHCGILRERTLRTAYAAFGHRLMRDVAVPGGVAADIASDGPAAVRALLDEVRSRFPALVKLYDSTASLQDRTVSTGIVTPALVRQFGAGGHVGRASGRAFDARKALACPPYDQLAFEVPVFEAGDVNARVWVRIREVEQSLGLVEQILDRLPSGPVLVPMDAAGRSGEGIGVAEAFRGDVLVWLRIADGAIARCHLRDASWFQWPLLEAAIEGNIVADFPLCNKSFNCSYSGHDL